jgi:heptosyltransferase-2
MRFSSLGDIVLTTPVLSKLRKAFPQAQIDMVVKKEFSDCISENPNINNLIKFDSKLGFQGLRDFIAWLKMEKYDLFVDIHRSLRSRVILFFVRGKKIKYSKDTFRRLVLLKLRLNLYRQYPRKIEDYLKPLKKIRIDSSMEPTQLFFSEEILKKAKKIAAHLNKKNQNKNKGIDNSRPKRQRKIIIGLAPGAAHFLKKWPLGKYKELIYLLSEKLNCKFWIFGGPNDFECEHLDSLPLDVINLQGHLTLKETAALISQCAILIGNDSGLSHIAEAVNVDAMTFFGPTSRYFGYFPYRETSHVFEKELSCRPCSKNGKGKCKNRSLKKCLEDISSNTVAKYILEYFKGKEA